MTTKRETILARIATVLAGTKSAIGFAEVELQYNDQKPHQLFLNHKDTVEQTTSLPTLDHTLTVRFSVI